MPPELVKVASSFQIWKTARVIHNPAIINSIVLAFESRDSSENGEVPHYIRVSSVPILFQIGTYKPPISIIITYANLKIHSGAIILHLVYVLFCSSCINENENYSLHCLLHVFFPHGYYIILISSGCWQLAFATIELIINNHRLSSRNYFT